MQHERSTSHSHGSHGHTHGIRQSGRRLLGAFILNLGFAIFELLGGLWTNSVAILSDAIHDFGDAIALGMGYALERYSHRRGNERYTYGYRRYSLLSALIISGILLISSTWVIIESIERILEPQQANAKGMMLFALIGIAINGLAAWRLKGQHSVNERAVALHLMEDVLGWVVVLLGSIVMMFVDFPILDPLLSIGITLWILYNVARNIWRTARIFLQHAPEDIDTSNLIGAIESVEHVESTHDLHLWSIDGDQHIMTIHVVMDLSYDWSQQSCTKEQIRQISHQQGIDHCTIELEQPGDCEYLHRCCE